MNQGKNNSLAQRYLAQARRNSGFSSADGTFSNPNDFGGNQFRGGMGNRSYSNADGNMPAAAPTPTSRPYSINITSTSGAAVSNFVILDANNKLLDTAKWTAGNYIDGSITISSGTPGVTYQFMLQQFQQQAFNCAQTYYSSATANQVQQTFSVETRDANGSFQGVPITPLLSPNQFQDGIIVVSEQYPVTGNTKITIASILPNATLQFKLFPSDKINVAAALDGQNPTRQYADPGIVQATPVYIKP